jgi:anionic cell wall polymer biosynthesis LytR-Cps2A-Psr (LCP) family protein
MDGALALKYVRSRHGYGVEGSDFARARRQQKVISAAKDKLLSKFNLFRPGMINNIICCAGKNFSSIHTIEIKYQLVI